jgi:hypothetical protein
MKMSQHYWVVRRCDDRSLFFFGPPYLQDSWVAVILALRDSPESFADDMPECYLENIGSSNDKYGKR